MSKTRSKNNKKSTKKNKKAKGNASTLATIDNPVSTKISDKEMQLMSICRSLKKQIEIENHALNEYQQYSTKIQSLQIIEKQKLEEIKMRIRNTVYSEIELNDTQEYELKQYQQKVKHLLFENIQNINDLRLRNEIYLQMCENIKKDEEQYLQKSIRSLFIQSKNSDLQFDQLFIDNNMQMFEKQLYFALRKKYQQKIYNLRLKYNEDCQQIRTRYSKKKRSEIKYYELLKNKYIQELIKKHKIALNDIKNYYSDIIHANLDLIKSLKSEVLELQKKEKSKELLMYDIMNVNKKLSQPLKFYLSKIHALTNELDVYSNEKILLFDTEKDIQSLEYNTENLEWKYEILQQQMKQLNDECFVIGTKLNKSLFGIQSKKQLKNILVQRKISDIESKIEKQNIYTYEILSSVNLQAINAEDNKSLDDVLIVKNESIKYLENECSEVREKYYNAIHYYENLMKKYSIPISELGFVPNQI